MAATFQQGLPNNLTYLQCLELGYEYPTSRTTTTEATTTATNTSETTPFQQQQQQLKLCCFQCRKQEETKEGQEDNIRLSRCSQCQVAAYCSRTCQINHWKTSSCTGSIGHKYTCRSYQRVGRNMTFPSDADRQEAIAELYGRLRMYVGPYAIHRSSQLGRGFIFLQSEWTLAEMSLASPQTVLGHSFGSALSTTVSSSPSSNVASSGRSVWVHFLTVGEFDSEICRDDFELTEVRTKLHDAVAHYEEQTTIVLLMRFRCGHVSLATTPLFPDYGICQRLGKDYYENSSAGALQLNIDDM